MQVTCIKCGETGILTKKPTVSKGIKYEYWYVQHVSFNKGKRKTKWCYLGKYESLSEEYRELIHKIIHKSEKPKLESVSRNTEPRWLSSVERQPRKLLVAGSKPARGSISS